MKTIDVQVSNLVIEDKDSFVNYNKLHQNNFFSLDYGGRIGYNLTRGEIAMKKPETGPTP